MMEVKIVDELLAAPTFFMNWLACKDPKTVVGRSCDEGACPLWAFLDECEDLVLVHVTVTMNDVVLVEEGLRLARAVLPEWARRFVRLVDIEFSQDAEVTALDAFMILDRMGFVKEVG